MPIIVNRIRNFLTETIRNHEFSHTILHQQNFVNPKVNINEIKHVSEEEAKNPIKNKPNFPVQPPKILVPQKQDNKEVGLKPPKPNEDAKAVIRQQNVANFLKNQPPISKPKPLIVAQNNRPISAQQSPINKNFQANKAENKKKEERIDILKQKSPIYQPANIKNANKESPLVKRPVSKPGTPALKPAPKELKRVLSNEPRKIEKKGEIDKGKAIIKKEAKFDKKIEADKSKELKANKEMLEGKKQINEIKAISPANEKIEKPAQNQSKIELKNITNKESNANKDNDKLHRKESFKGKESSNLSKSEEKKEIDKVFPRKVSKEKNRPKTEVSNNRHPAPKPPLPKPVSNGFQDELKPEILIKNKESFIQMISEMENIITDLNAAVGNLNNMNPTQKKAIPAFDFEFTVQPQPKISPEDSNNKFDEREDDLDFEESTPAKKQDDFADKAVEEDDLIYLNDKQKLEGLLSNLKAELGQEFEETFKILKEKVK